MKLIKISIALFAFILSVSAVQAQKGKTRLSLGYNVGLPMGSFKDNVSETSIRGFKADVLYGINDKLSIGFGTGYQDFYQKNPRQLYKLSDGSDISAVVSHSIQTIPLLAMAKYSFTPGATVQPYAALGVGGNLVSYTELLGEFGQEQAKFGFAARPEAGVYIPFKKTGEAGLTIGASYNVMPFNQDAFNNLNNLGLHAGVTIPLRK
ncbi:MAG TPA: outer membrane beta-barrel protein [Flavisolibacter sp.]|jgi:opacity protein-like surface antigen|nr:outer membrane beta-barrel protein [Flavisolibacter sp.]